MKYFSKLLYFVTLICIIFISCTNSESSHQASKDSSEKKFDPAGEQKNSDTYDPKKTATDTMYKNKDSIPK